MNYGGCGLCNIHAGWKKMPVSTQKHLLYSVETLLCAVQYLEAFLRCHLGAEQFEEGGHLIQCRLVLAPGSTRRPQGDETDVS